MYGACEPSISCKPRSMNCNLGLLLKQVMLWAPGSTAYTSTSSASLLPYSADPDPLDRMILCRSRANSTGVLRRVDFRWKRFFARFSTPLSITDNRLQGSTPSLHLALFRYGRLCNFRGRYQDLGRVDRGPCQTGRRVHPRFIFHIPRF